MAEARRDDVRIHYLDEGQGTAALLIHGHTLDLRVWDDVALLLMGSGARVLRPDLRGHGRSSRPEKGYHPSHHAADMAAVLDAADVGRALVVGHSIGGGVALEMALTMPGRVSGLVLVEPVLPDRAFEPAFFANLKEVAGVTRSEGIRAAMLGPWLSNPLFEGSLRRPGMRERLAAVVADFPGAEYLATERDRVERDWTMPDRLGEIAVPTTVLLSDATLPSFEGYAEEIAREVPGAGLVRVAGCGHLMPWEAPDTVAEAILAQLRG